MLWQPAEDVDWADTARLRFLLYSHDGVGLGHFRRNLVLAQALIDRSPQASVLLACAAEGIETFPLPTGVDVLRLPGLRKIDNGAYVARRLSLEPAELLALRSSLLASAVLEFRPHVLLADKHPLGVKGELEPALDIQRSSGRRAALGLRDVLDDAAGTAAEWRDGCVREGVARFYQRLLVYGSLDLLTPLAEDMLPRHLTRLVRFCGYVIGSAALETPAEDLPSRDNRPLVLATAGGGEDGLPLLRAFVEAARRDVWRGVIVAGPQMEPMHWEKLRALADRADVPAFRSVREIARWYQHVDALVAMGGYNTVVEAVSSGTPTVCVPRTRPRREQLTRARAFAARNLLWLVEPEELTVGRLGEAINHALAVDRTALRARARATLDLRGAERAAAHLIELADQVRDADWASDDGESTAGRVGDHARAVAARGAR